MSRKALVKYTSKITIAIAIVLTLVLSCPSLVAEASSPNYYWKFSAMTDHAIGYQSFSSGVKGSADLNITVFSNYLGYSTVDTSLVSKYGKRWVFTYEPVDYTIRLGARTTTSGKYTYQDLTIPDSIKPYIKDNLGNMYYLDLRNGGSFVIEDMTGINRLELCFSGTLTGTQALTPASTSYKQIVCLFDCPAFNIVRHAEELPTITDSEGTVWTVPEGVENPVVIKTSKTQKYLLDAQPGLSCFKNPLPDYSSSYVLGAEEYIDAVLYDYDMVTHKALLREDYAAELGIEPIYCTNMWWFTEFLYGSLPEISVTPLTATPTESPEPTVPPETPDPDGIRNLGTVTIENSPGGLVKEGTVYVHGGDLIFETKHADFVSNAEPTGFDYIRHAVIEDYCPKFIGRFTLDVDVDGYVSMQFPDLFLFPDMIKPEEYVPLDADKVVFPTGSGLPEIGLLSEWAEPIVVLYANGTKYYVSPYGGNVQIPVNKGENVVMLEIGLQVKDEFLSNHEGFIQTVYWAFLEDFAVYIREYQDQVSADISSLLEQAIKQTEELKVQTEESKKQTEALTKYPGSDKMDSDNDALGGAMDEYNKVEDSIFESAGSNIDSFDISEAFAFNPQMLAAFAFLGTIISKIIVNMGDFSMIYTVGAALVLFGIITGMWKFVADSSRDSMRQSGSNGRSGKGSGRSSGSGKGGGK